MLECGGGHHKNLDPFRENNLGVFTRLLVVQIFSCGDSCWSSLMKPHQRQTYQTH